ncbi:hypothetical protein BY458DRAFT_553642 [Sporodiniella umbellata]|nr:hypothetical protein BY458DRAFT_553642 [Sporodiniella umbellata]
MVPLLEQENTYIEHLNKLCLLLSELKAKNSGFTELSNIVEQLATFHHEKVKTDDVEEFLLSLTNKQTKQMYLDYFSLCTPPAQEALDGTGAVNVHRSPLKQLDYYKAYFNNLPKLANTQLLLKANQVLDALINPLLHLDTTHVIDIIAQTPVDHYHLTRTAKPLLDHTLFSIDLQKELRVILTENGLLICGNNQLLYPLLSLDCVQAQPLEDELSFQLIIHAKRTLALRTNFKNDRDMWLSLSLKEIAHKLSQTTVKNNDLFCYFQDPSGEISSAESSDDDSWNKHNPVATLETTIESSKTLEPKPIASLKQPEVVKHRKSFIRSVFSAVSSPQLKKTKSNTLLTANVDAPTRGASLHHQSSYSSFSSGQSITTPPLSRSGSPGASTPNSHLRNSSSYSSDEFNESQPSLSPPKSPDTIKQVLHRDDQCQVFHWKDNTWYAAEESSVLEVRKTYSHRPCVTVHMKKTGQMYLNAWISKEMSVQRISETDINLTIQCPLEEHYLVHCLTQPHADQLEHVLKDMLVEQSIRLSPSQEDLTKSLKSIMECKSKLYLNSSSSKWRSFGSVHLKVSQHTVTKKMHLAVESHKSGKTTQLVSAMVQSRNVERLGPKQISLLFNNDKTSVVYMIKVREESVADQIMDHLKDKNAEFGW